MQGVYHPVPDDRTTTVLPSSTLTGPTTISPVVTRFFWPPEMPRTRWLPTTVSAHTCHDSKHGCWYTPLEWNTWCHQSAHSIVGCSCLVTAVTVL